MSQRKEEVMADIQSMTPQGCQDALNFLVGFNLPAVSKAVDFVRENYPHEFTEEK